MADPFCNRPGSKNDSTDLCGCQRDPWVYIHFVDYSNCILLPWLGLSLIHIYIKEIVRGESYIELSEEEAESLDQAVYQEMYDPDVQDSIKPQ